MKHYLSPFVIVAILLIQPLLLIGQNVQFSSTTVSVGLGPRSIVLMELNQDGNPDLAVANMLGSSISLLYGNGFGTFTLQDSIATIHKGPHNIATNDFNGDGVLDAVTANKDSNTIAVFLGDGAGGFLAPTFYATGSGPRWIAIADFNADDYPDLAVTNRSDDNITVFLGDSLGNFVNIGNFYTGNGPVPIAAGWFNADTIIDLAVGNDLGDSLVILAGDGTGAFTIESAFPVGNAPKDIALGDLNMDGFVDIAVANVLDSTVTVLFADGLGGFTSSSYVVGSGPIALVIGDFDGDGNNDLAVSDALNNNVAVLRGDGTGGFAAAETFPVGLLPKALLSGDFNSDGRLDLAVTNTGGNSVTILLNQTPPQACVNVQSVIQRYFFGNDFSPDPIISPVGLPLRLLMTTTLSEHVNGISILPWITSTYFLLAGQILTVQFTPTDTGTYQIRNLGHQFTGDLVIVENAKALDTKVIQMGQQSIALIHSNTQQKNFPDTIRALKGIPLTIYNTSLDDEHWVSIDPWVTAPIPPAAGNVQPNQLTTFTFTPTDTGSYDIIHTVNGYIGKLIVVDSLLLGQIVANNDAVTTDSTVAVVIDVQSNDADPDGDPLTTSIISGPNNGTAIVLNGDSIQYTPDSTFTGIDTITYQVCDAGTPSQCCDQAIVVITVTSLVNTAPIANNDVITTDSAVVVVIDVQLNDIDPDGDSLTTSILSGPNNGTAIVLNGDSIQYTPNTGFTGMDTITYEVCDNGGLCDQAIVVITVSSVVGIDDRTDDPQFKVFPNPFNTETKINYSLQKAGLVTIIIYNQLGQPVKHLVNERKSAGQHTALWDGRGNSGALLTNAVYFYQIRTEEFVHTKNFILMK